MNKSRKNSRKEQNIPEEMKILFERYEQLCALPQELSCKSIAFITAAQEKLIFALACLLFPSRAEKNDVPCFLSDEYGLCEEEGLPVENSENFSFRHKLTWSDTWCLLGYYYDSPYWELVLREMSRYEGEIPEEVSGKEEEAICSLLLVNKDESILEKGAAKILNEDHNLLSRFPKEDEVDYVDDIIVLRSALLPYFYKSKALFQKHRDIIHMVGRAADDLLYCFGENAICLDGQELQYVYFVMSDNSSAVNFGYCPGGLLSFNKQIMLAGKVIDDAILYLDTIYHFLPEEIKKMQK